MAKITGTCHRMHFLDLQHLYEFWTAALMTIFFAVWLPHSTRTYAYTIHNLHQSYPLIAYLLKFYQFQVCLGVSVHFLDVFHLC